MKPRDEMPLDGYALEKREPAPTGTPRDGDELAMDACGRLRRISPDGTEWWRKVYEMREEES